jgi:hypothetical protein
MGMLKNTKSAKKSQNHKTKKTKKDSFHWPLRFLDRVLKKSCYDDN